MKIEIQFKSRIAGAIGSSDTMKAIVDTSVCKANGGIIATLYKTFPAREHFLIEKAWELNEDLELIPINLDLLIQHF